MKKILIIGGGAMGSAFSIPCLNNNNNVTITEPHSKLFINNLLCGSVIVTLLLLFRHGIEKAEPIAPPPIIKIFFITI